MPGRYPDRGFRHTHPGYAMSDHLHTLPGSIGKGSHTHDNIIALGIDTTPTISAGGNTVRQVTIRPTLPSTDYEATAGIGGSLTLLGALQVTNINKVSGSRVDVTVQNTGLVSLGGASITVNCIMNQ